MCGRFSYMAAIMFIRRDGDLRILTKGDNNNGDDRSLYNRGQWWLKKENVVGRVKGCVERVRGLL